MECFSEEVIEGIFELGVETLEMSRHLLVICTWASSKTFRLNLPKIELVSPKKIKVSPFKTDSSLLPHLSERHMTTHPAAHSGKPESSSPPLHLLYQIYPQVGSFYPHLEMCFSPARDRGGRSRETGTTCFLVQVAGGSKCGGLKGGPRRQTSWVQIPALHLGV